MMKLTHLFHFVGDFAIVGGEECDDGNLLENDGCSPQCVYEPYFYCLRQRVEMDYLSGALRYLPDSLSDAEAI